MQGVNLKQHIAHLKYSRDGSFFFFQGNLHLDYIFQSDFGMVLTGNNSENNETNLHLTASGKILSYLKWSMVDDYRLQFYESLNFYFFKHKMFSVSPSLLIVSGFLPNLLFRVVLPNLLFRVFLPNLLFRVFLPYLLFRVFLPKPTVQGIPT